MNDFGTLRLDDHQSLSTDTQEKPVDCGDAETDRQKDRWVLSTLSSLVLQKADVSFTHIGQYESLNFCCRLAESEKCVNTEDRNNMNSELPDGATVTPEDSGDPLKILSEASTPTDLAPQTASKKVNSNKKTNQNQQVRRSIEIFNFVVQSISATT